MGCFQSIFTRLPSGNPTSTSKLTTEGGTGAGIHGSVARGSSLPYDKDEPSSNFIEQLTKLNKLEMTTKYTPPSIIVESLQPENKLEYSKKNDEIKKKFGKEEIVEKSGLVIPVNSDDKQIMVLEEKNEKVIHSSDISEVEEKLGEKEMPEQLLMDVSEKSDNEQTPMLEETAEKMISSGSIPIIEGNLDKKKTSEKSIVFTSEKLEYEQIPLLEEKAENVVDSEMEFRLTMIRSVREAVNKICEQAVERTTEIVKSGYGSQKMASSIRSERDAANESDAEFSDFSLPPPLLSQSTTTIGDHLDSTAQECSWPAPPPQDTEEEQTIAPNLSFDLPDPPSEVENNTISETDTLDISDEVMRATGLPSDDEEKLDTEYGRLKIKVEIK